MRKYTSFLVLAITAYLFVLQSCEEPTEVGRGVVPPNDALFADSVEFDVIVNTFRDDSIFLSNLSQPIIGHHNSPVFGSGFASLFNEVGFSEGYETDPTYMYDSITIALRAVGYEGDTLTPQSFNIYRMADSINSRSSYYADTSWLTSTLIGSFNNILPSRDSVFVAGELVPNHLTTRLDDGLGNFLFTNLNDSTIISDSTLQSLFNGIHIEPDLTGTGKGIFDINIASNSSNDNYSGIYVHFHNATDTQAIHFEFDILGSNSLSGNYEPGRQNHNRVWHDFSTAEAGLTAQLPGYSASGFPDGYLVGGAGTAVLLEFPDVRSTIPSDAQINRAEMIFSGEINDDADSLRIPSVLVLGEKFNLNTLGNPAGTYTTISGNTNSTEQPDPDRFYDISDSAFADVDENGELRYEFNFPLYVQNIVAGTVSDSLYLFPQTRIGTFNAIKIGGTNNLSRPVKLKVIYSQPQ